MMSKTKPSEQNGEGSPEIICLDDDSETVSTDPDEISVIDLEPDSPDCKPLLPFLRQTRYESPLPSPPPLPLKKEDRVHLVEGTLMNQEEGQMFVTESLPVITSSLSVLPVENFPVVIKNEPVDGDSTFETVTYVDPLPVLHRSLKKESGDYFSMEPSIYSDSHTRQEPMEVEDSEEVRINVGSSRNPLVTHLNSNSSGIILRDMDSENRRVCMVAQLSSCLPCDNLRETDSENRLDLLLKQEVSNSLCKDSKGMQSNIILKQEPVDEFDEQSCNTVSSGDPVVSESFCVKSKDISHQNFQSLLSIPIKEESVDFKIDTDPAVLTMSLTPDRKCQELEATTNDKELKCSLQWLRSLKLGDVKDAAREYLKFLSKYRTLKDCFSIYYWKPRVKVEVDESRQHTPDFSSSSLQEKTNAVTDTKLPTSSKVCLPSEKKVLLSEDNTFSTASLPERMPSFTTSQSFESSKVPKKGVKPIMLADMVRDPLVDASPRNASSTSSQDNLLTEATVATVPVPTILDGNTPLLSTEKLLEIIQNVSSSCDSAAAQNQNFSQSFTPRSSPAPSKIHPSQAAASLCATEGSSGGRIFDSGSPCPPEEITKKRAQPSAAPNESTKKQKLSIAEYAQRRTSIPGDSVCPPRALSGLFSHFGPQFADGGSYSLAPSSQYPTPYSLPYSIVSSYPMAVGATTRNNLISPAAVESRSLKSPPQLGSSTTQLRDPRLPLQQPSGTVAAALPSVSSFEPRLGSRECLACYSYTDIGSRFISGDITAYVLQWNPSWFAAQRKMLVLAPICDSYEYARYTYRDEADYYSTYVRFLFLSIWMKMDEAEKNSPVITAEVTDRNVVQLSHVNFVQYTAKCCVEDQRILLKREDIILCRTKAGKIQQIFGHVTDVLSANSQSSAGAGSTIKVKMTFRCIEPLDCEMHEGIDVKVLCNMRLASLQNKALYNLSEVVKHVVLDPKTFDANVDLLQFLHGKREDVKVIRDKILYSVSCSDTRAVLVNSDALQCEMVDLLAHLAYQLNLKKDSFVLVCVGNEDVLLRLAKRLKPYEPVVAVRAQEMRQALGSDLAKFSLQELLRSKPITEIYRRESSRITLTLYTAALFKQAGEVLKRKGVICILADADACTEAESALPLMYGATKLILFGRPEADVTVPPVLKKYRYNMSLYQRLLKCKGS